MRTLAMTGFVLAAFITIWEFVRAVKLARAGWAVLIALTGPLGALLSLIFPAPPAPEESSN